MLGACTFTYIPVIPNAQNREAQLLLIGELHYEEVEETLVLNLKTLELPSSNWLALQWFNPQGKEVASDALWLSPEMLGEGLNFILPKDVMWEYGYWRAVLSFEQKVIRQFALEVQAPQGDTDPTNPNNPDEPTETTSSSEG
ncbi:MAG: hypothetical protein R2880_15020 [Deinococcales bacterium]